MTIIGPWRTAHEQGEESREPVEGGRTTVAHLSQLLLDVDRDAVECADDKERHSEQDDRVGRCQAGTAMR